MLSFDWELIRQALPALGKGMIMTLKITCTAMLFGVVWGTLLAVARLSPFAPLRWLAKLYVNLFRSVPLILVLMWFYLIVPQLLASLLGIGRGTDIRLVSAMIAFALFEAAYYSEIMRAGLNSIPRGQGQAALALGMTRFQALRLVLLPQAFRIMTPLLLTQGIVLFQDTSLVYVIGLADFFRTATNIGVTTGLQVQMVLLAGLVYFVICFCVSWCVVLLKKRMAV